MKFEKTTFGVLLPGVSRIQIGPSYMWRGNVRTREDELTAFVKLIEPRSLIIELGCVTLARAMGLPVPKPLLVQVQPTMLPDAPHKTVIGIGSEDASYPDCRSFVRRDEDVVRKALLRWPHLFACAAFDLWVGVEDHYPENLLFNGKNDFRVIDYDSAFQSHLMPTTVTKAELVRLVAEGKNEFEKLTACRSMLAALGPLDKLDWAGLKAAIPYQEITGGERLLSDLCLFLKERATCLRSLLSAELGLKQLELVYDAENSDHDRRRN